MGRTDGENLVAIDDHVQRRPADFIALEIDMTDILKVGIAHLGPDRQRGRGLDDGHIHAIDLDPRFAAQGDDRDIAGGGTAIDSSFCDGSKSPTCEVCAVSA